MDKGCLYVKEVYGRGRGVFAGREFLPGEIIETVPVIVIPHDQWELADATILESYAFKWGEDKFELAIALGFGSMYNHSFSPNARYIKDIKNKQITFECLSKIAKDEEVVMNYNGNPTDTTPIVFEGDTWRKVPESSRGIDRDIH